MTKSEIKENISACFNQRQLCRISLRYEGYDRYYFPLITSEKLFLGAEENDFLLDGYALRRFRDITKAEMKNDFCQEILVKEGVVDSLVVPDLDITNWQTVFQFLQARNQNVIVEKESLDEDEREFVIGRIEKIYKTSVYIRHFDADGIWQSEPYKFPFSKITTVTFASRYVDTFSKYLGDLPENFGK